MASQLQNLARFVCDSIDGYRKAHERADDVDLKEVFASRIHRRETTLARLNAALSAAGEEQITSGSALGTFHQMWGAVIDALGSSDTAVIRLVEEGEDFLRLRFEEALRDDLTTEEERRVIACCMREIAQAEFFAHQLDGTLV